MPDLAGRNRELLDLLESLPDAILVVNNGGRIAFANVHVVKMFGYSAREISGQPMEILMPERFRHRHTDFVQRYLENPYVRPMGESTSLVGQQRSGSEIPLEIYLSPLFLHDRKYVIAAIRDITERLKIEEELRRSRDEVVHSELVHEMQERFRAEEQLRENQVELAHISRLSILGEMTSSLGHEINQPLAAITNYANGCINRQRRGELESETLVDVLQRISSEAARASEILKRFRSFARREQLQREWINAESLVSEALRLTEFEADRHHISLQLRVDGSMPQVYVDILQIQQVIVNLVRNAIEAMIDPPAQELTINIYLRRPHQGLVVIAIEDHGHGIADDQRDELFTPFYSTKQNGLGIGLSLSRSIIESHGGSLSVANNEQHAGATFTMTLPETDEAIND